LATSYSRSNNSGIQNPASGTSPSFATINSEVLGEDLGEMNLSLASNTIYSPLNPAPTTPTSPTPIFPVFANQIHASSSIPIHSSMAPLLLPLKGIQLY
jgi:hypothetical protein